MLYVYDPLSSLVIMLLHHVMYTIQLQVDSSKPCKFQEHHTKMRLYLKLLLSWSSQTELVSENKNRGTSLDHACHRYCIWMQILGIQKPWVTLLCQRTVRHLHEHWFVAMVIEVTLILWWKRRQFGELSNSPWLKSTPKSPGVLFCGFDTNTLLKHFPGIHAMNFLFNGHHTTFMSHWRFLENPWCRLRLLSIGYFGLSITAQERS